MRGAGTNFCDSANRLGVIEVSQSISTYVWNTARMLLCQGEQHLVELSFVCRHIEEQMLVEIYTKLELYSQFLHQKTRENQITTVIVVWILPDASRFHRLARLKPKQTRTVKSIDFFYKRHDVLFGQNMFLMSGTVQPH